MGSASTGTATDLGCVPETEDTITLLVDWEKKDGSGRRATGVYTASWTAPQKAGVHSNQYFHYMGSKGEVRVNQAKRGYDVTEDEGGLTCKFEIRVVEVACTHQYCRVQPILHEVRTG